jgi:YhhN-like protein
VTAPATTPSVRSPWLIGFALVAVAELICTATGLRLAAFLTWLVAPLLAGWVWRARGPKLLVAALISCWAGDVLGNPRLIGVGPIGLYLSIAAFAVADVLLITLFVRRGALRSHRSRRQAGAAALYLVPASIAFASVWGHLDPTLRVVAAIYLLLIAATAATALLLGTRVGIGVGLLFSSHLLVALEVGQRVDGTATIFRVAVLALYMAGILLIAVDLRSIGTRRQRGWAPGGSNPEPAD